MATEGLREPRTEPFLEHRVTVRTGYEPYRTDVSVRGHTWVVDEPEEIGGMDLGPMPYDLLCGALAACTAITVRMYADRKEWPLESVAVAVELSRAGVSGWREGESDVFRVTLEFEGELDGAKKHRLTEIAERCPMHRALTAGAVIETAAS